MQEFLGGWRKEETKGLLASRGFSLRKWSVYEFVKECNLKCKFCYIPPNTEKSIPDLPLIYHIIDEITDMGCRGVVLTGGEPFYYPRFKDVYKYVIKKGLLVEVQTNGVLITPNLINLIKKYPFHMLKVSLYAASPSTYEKITGSTSIFDKILDNLKLLQREGINFYIFTLITKLNKDEIEKIREIAYMLGVNFFTSNFIYIPPGKKDDELKYGEKFKKIRCSGYLFIDSDGFLDIL